jgi:CBS domain-containing protein
MSHPAETVPPDLPVRKVARVMIAHNIHRVVIADEDRPIGILSVTDLLRAVADERVVTPVQHAMRAPVVTVDASAPLHEAADLLAAAHVHGLVVVEATWPVGVFTQREALEARELPRDTPVEAAMSCAMLCLPPDTPLHRAAAFLAGTRARRLLVVEGRRLKGTATAVDLVGVIATA